MFAMKPYGQQVPRIAKRPPLGQAAPPTAPAPQRFGTDVKASIPAGWTEIPANQLKWGDARKGDFVYGMDSRTNLEALFEVLDTDGRVDAKTVASNQPATMPVGEILQQEKAQPMQKEPSVDLVIFRKPEAAAAPAPAGGSIWPALGLVAVVALVIGYAASD